MSESGAGGPVRPLIGVCAALEQARWGVWDLPADILPRMYVEAVQRSNGAAVLLPVDTGWIENPGLALDRLDGLLLAGGSDVDPDHPVRLADGSLVARAAGGTVVNTKSHHHEAIDRPGEGLVITGWSQLDELPEVVEIPDRRFPIGVQWHPEAGDDDWLTIAFVEAARAGAKPA